MKLVNTIPTTTEDEALLPRKASPWRGLVVRAAAVSLALGLVASAATGGVSTTSLSSTYPKNQPDKYPYWDNLGADWLYGGIYVYGEYPDDDDLESANVYVDDEPYD